MQTKNLVVGLALLGLAGSLAVALAAPMLADATPSSPAISAPRAQAPDLSEIVRRLQRHYQETRSFEAKFKERIVSVGGAERNREGTIAYRKPGRLRWDFAPPQTETIVSDGKTLYVYQPDLNQVVETPLARAFKSSVPAALLLGIGDIERDFVASLPEASSDPAVHLRLAAKGDGTRIAVALDPNTYDIVALEMTDQLGNVTVLNFSEIRTGVSLADSLFAFKVPEGTDVVAAPDLPP